MAFLNTDRKAASTQVVQQYQTDIEALKAAIDLLILKIEKGEEDKVIQEQFQVAKASYKKIEWLVEYYHGYTAKFINGPALEEAEPEDRAIIIQPEGLQVIEELLFPQLDQMQKATLLQQVKLLRSTAGRLQHTAATLEITDAHVFDALRLEVFRIITMGISGFDSPVAQQSMQEASAALKGIEQYARIYAPKLENQNQALADSLWLTLQQAQAFLASQKDFETFDRMAFIKGYANPLSVLLWKAQTRLGLHFFTEPRPLRSNARTLFDSGIFNPDYYTAGTTYYSSPAKVALGKKLFYDVILSNNGTRSCASCHQPEKAFADGLKTNTALSGNTLLKRNTPTLLNAALQPALFYDLRVTYLEDQANEVITNKEEMHGSLPMAVQSLRRDTTYQKLFGEAYQQEEIGEHQIKNALAAYIRSLTPLNARFDQYMRGNNAAMTKQEISGFNLFMGKAKCGTCHFSPLFSGVNPPQFTKVDAEVLGVPATADTLHPTLDTDTGKYGLYKLSLHQHAFKTPTLRNIALTAPYMHNGVYQTLEEVMDFYDKGGGKGLGLSIANQTLPEERLQLTPGEKGDIIAFLKTLTDTALPANTQ